MKICVQGLWHLGSVTAACMASIGHDVVALDFNSATLEGLSQGNAPLFEPRLDALLSDAIAAKKLTFIDSSAAIPSDTELLWITYDTPVDEDHADVAFVMAQIQKTLPALPNGATILVSSQMPVGSIKALETYAQMAMPEKCFGFACSPENLRLGKAIDVFLKPDRIVVGVRNGHDQMRIETMLLPITDKLEWMSVESAEMTKHAINAFLATSVTFANEIAAICEKVGADAKQVERGLKTEQRIGPKAYLSPGGAFAGGTLARDIAFLSAAASANHLRIPLLSAVKPSNDEHKHWARRKLLEQFPDLSGVPITVWGLTYKAGTDTLRRSMSVELCHWLVSQGAALTVHDPAVLALPEEWSGHVVRAHSPLGALANAKALVVATEWPEYQTIDVAHVIATAPQLLVIDANRFLAPFEKESGILYQAVGTHQTSAA